MAVPLGHPSTQSKVSKAQKIKGILNVFGVYDFTNNQIWTHGYKQKTGKQFLDFIKRVDQKYDDSIKQIFLVLDNVSIHRSNKVKETIARYYPRIQLVFLPTRYSELNLIEVGWLWMHKQGINNSTFLNGQDIGKAVSDWTCDHNQKHRIKTSTISLHGKSINIVYLTLNPEDHHLYRHTLGHNIVISKDLVSSQKVNMSVIGIINEV